MQEVSASSLTMVFFQTEANRSSLVTGWPARSNRALKTAADLGVKRISWASDHRRAVWRSNRYSPNVTGGSIAILRAATDINPGEIPANSRQTHRTSSQFAHTFVTQRRRRSNR